MDLTIEGKIYINGTFEKCCIGIDDGKISAIKKILKGEKHYSFGKSLILPAGIDLHVHFRDPGRTYKEDFATGTMAATFGGLSCVFDMPNTIPQTTSIYTILEKKKLAEKKAHVDFGLYAGITNGNLKDIDKLVKYCNGFKIFLGTTTNSLMFDKKNLKEVFKNSTLSKKPVLIHAECDKCLLKHKRKESNLVDHLNSRPNECEEEAIKHILSSSKNSSCKIHICHLSSCEGLELLKNRTKNISCGVTPHHSLFSIEKQFDSQGFFKVNPPIRTKFDRETLFEAIKNGTVDILESDHAPHTLEEKSVDFSDVPTGMPGVEVMYPLFLYMAKKETLSFQRMISLLCERPAEIIGIPKGKIAVGNDADFIVINLKDDCKISSEKLHSKCGWTPYEGWPAIFPSHVFVRGERLIEDYEMQGTKGFGRFVGA